MQTQRFVAFGVFRLDVASRMLFRDGELVALTPKVIDTLVLLVENRGRLLSKEDLLQRLWPDTFVEESNLSQNISVLRKALSDTAARPQYIETIPKRGYRFVANVRECDDLSAGQPAKSANAGRRRIPAMAVASLLLVAGILLAWQLWPKPPRVMMAVLPFADYSEDPGQEYFSAGLTEEMISVLGGLFPDQLGVIARTSVERYKTAEKPIDEIGRELGVDYVVEGSVRKEDTGIRITAQLIQVSDQTHLWSASYDGPVQDLVRLQTEIAQAIAKEIHIKLGRQSQARLNRLQRSVKPDAYEAYLRGMYNSQAEHFQQAIELDPNYAPAYAGLARVFYFRGFGGTTAPHEAFSEVTKAARKALELDPDLAEAWGLLGLAQLHYEWDFVGAERSFRRALALNPSGAGVRHSYAHHLLWVGREEESVAQSNQAMNLDPIDAVLTACVGWHNLQAGRYDEAVEWARKGLLITPKLAWGRLVLGWGLEQQGKPTEAIAAFSELSGGRPYSDLAHALAVAGRRDEAREMLVQLLDQAPERYLSPYGIAVVYVGLDDHEEALKWLEKSYEGRDSKLVYLRWDPRFKQLRSSAEFQGLITRIGTTSVRSTADGSLPTTSWWRRDPTPSAEGIELIQGHPPS